MNTGIEIIAKERQRQIEYKGKRPEQFCDLTQRHYVKAAMSYCFVENHFKNQSENNRMPPLLWPFEKEFFNPDRNNDIRNLAKAGAYIAAEIDRLLEIEQKQNP
jgi:hypothetical protein